MASNEFDLPVLGICGWRLFEPSDSKTQAMVEALIESLEHDKGEWEVTIQDHFPFLPLRRYIHLKSTVASRVLDALEVVPSDNAMLNTAVRRWLQGQDRELRESATYLQERGRNNSGATHVEWLINNSSLIQKEPAHKSRN